MPDREVPNGTSRVYDLKWAVNAGLFLGHYSLFLVNGYGDADKGEVVKRELEKCFTELGIVPNLPDANPNGGYPIDRTRALEKQLRESIKKTLDNPTANLFSLVWKFTIFSLTEGDFVEEEKQAIVSDLRNFARKAGSDEDTVLDFFESLLVEQDSRNNVLKGFIEWIYSEIDKGILKPPEPAIEGDLADIKRIVVELLEISQTNQTALEKLCRIVLHSDTLLHDIDSVLNEMLPEIHRDVEEWIESIEKSTALSINERETLIKELGEIVKMSSAGKILASLPLIPGFLQYQYELGVSVNWNKWLGKLHSLFKKG